MSAARTHGNAKRKWTPEQHAKFKANLRKQKKDGTGFYSPERLAKLRRTKAQKRNAAGAPAHVGNGQGNGVDMDAAHDAGGQHFALDAIPDRMPPMVAPAGQRRPRKSAASDGPEFPNNAEGARLAVAMELLRTVNQLLRRDD